MIELVRGCKTGHAMLLVEHDMDAVFALADVLTVMADGRVIARGAPGRSGPIPPCASPISARARDDVAALALEARAAGDLSTARARSCAGSTSAIAARRAVALLGRNGMGKTTLLRSMIGLVADRARRVRIDGPRYRAGAHPSASPGAGVALVPEGRGIFGYSHVVENLVMAARAGTDGPRPGHCRASSTCSLVSRIAATRAAPALRWRAADADDRARPDDQPRPASSSTRRRRVWRRSSPGDLANGWGDTREGIASILVDKDLRALSRVVDRVLLMSKGKVVVLAGGPAALAQPALLERYLGV